MLNKSERQNVPYSSDRSSQMRFMQSRDYESSKHEHSHLQVMVKLDDKNWWQSRMNDESKFDCNMFQNEKYRVSYTFYDSYLKFIN